VYLSLSFLGFVLEISEGRGGFDVRGAFEAVGEGVG
jgi:hypothetical protein